MALSDSEHFNLADRTEVSFPDEVSDDQRQAIVDHLSHYVSLVQAPSDNSTIKCVIKPGLTPEQYELSITSDNITIEAGDAAGIFYAFQSLAQLIDPQHEDDIKIPTGMIKDQPRFGYRGFMLDVARNFHKKDKVLQVLDLMSRYKLNKFHFHLMDDEGWRLEIPDLPELTKVGGTRGYTPDESDRLRPAYGSGGIAEDSYSTGYYTRADYIDIIQYAAARHIEVIPEIDLPGHARAAIISMRARYNRLMAAGKKEQAEEYLLHDPDDQSEYSSAQNYNDNVINLCRESSYTFIEKVIRETIKMHADARVPLKVLHTGGDEVPYGAWQKSPMCQSFLSEMENLNGTDELHPNMLYFIRGILNEYDIVTAGWEEIVLQHSSEGHNGTQINEDLLGEPMLPYVWNATWGSGREDMAYKLANAGFDAVMCNSASYYFDLAYDNDPREGGLDWSGLTNAKTAFDLEPLDIMAKATHDLRGNPLDPAYIQSKERLTKSGEDQIKGIQAQLWSETLYHADLVDYMIFPKIFGLAQRAWSPRTADYDREYHNFVNTVGQRELIRLDQYKDGGVQYRIPPPGINRTGETTEINTVYPGLEIRYTVDGSKPTPKSALYTDPIKVSNGTVIKAKAYNTLSRGSKVSSLN
jgi:hexosaminidase